MTSLEDDVRNGWLGLRQNVERVPIRAYEKKKKLHYRTWARYSTSRTVERSAWHAYEPSCRRDATQYGLQDARISTSADASGLLERAIWGLRWGLIYRDILVAFLNLEPMDCALCGDYLIRPDGRCPQPRCSMAPWEQWEQHGGG